MTTPRIPRIQKKILLLIIFLLALCLISAHILLKRNMNTRIAEQIAHLLQSQPLIAHIEYQSSNAGLLALIRQNYTLYNLTITFNDPHLNAPIRLRALSLKNPQLDASGHLLSAQLDIQDLAFQNYADRIDERSSLTAYFIKTAIQRKKPLLMSGFLKINPSLQQLQFQVLVKHGPETILTYEAALEHFELPPGALSLDDLYHSFRQSKTESSHSEFNFSDNFLDPKLTAPIPMIQVIAKEMGYYSLKGELHFNAEFNRTENHHHARLNVKIDEAMSLFVDTTLINSKDNQSEQMITPPLPLNGTQIVSAEAKLHDLGLLKRLFPIMKVYFNLGQDDIMIMFTSLQKAQTAAPLKKAIGDLIAFIKNPNELMITLDPAEPFDPTAIITEIKTKNQRNFAQYQQEMAGVNNDDTRKKVTEFFSFKQDDSLTQALVKIGFNTQHH